MKLRVTGMVFACVVFAAPPSAQACAWDSDTLLQERSRFPTALELMTGKFIRHTPEFYAWRVKDRLSRITKEPDNLALVDDLAVAHDKLKQHAEAIAAMLAILPRDPLRYETLANLGTFYLHNGEFERGIEFIDRALEVNPDAHFGRERYQRWLAEYVLAKRGPRGPLVLPLSPPRKGGFEAFLAAKRGVDELALADSQAAVNGVLGMMRFGQHDSPILCEALGDLLAAPRDFSDGKLLASRAYLMAAHASKDPAVRADYELKAGIALSSQTTADPEKLMTLAELKAALQRERVEADAWYEVLAAREAGWVLHSPDPESEVRRLYAIEPSLSREEVAPAESLPGFFTRHWLVSLALVGGFFASMALGLRLARGPKA